MWYDKGSFIFSYFDFPILLINTSITYCSILGLNYFFKTNGKGMPLKDSPEWINLPFFRIRPFFYSGGGGLLSSQACFSTDGNLSPELIRILNLFPLASKLFY